MLQILLILPGVDRGLGVEESAKYVYENASKYNPADLPVRVDCSSVNGSMLGYFLYANFGHRQ
jgi:hypothetical protein